MSSSITPPSRIRVLAWEVLRFGMVGGLGFIVDLAVFNILVVTVLSPAELHEGPLIAKLVSACLAIMVNWLGNRYWTFRHRRRSDMLRESIEFFVVSVLGTGIGLGCLWFSHYVLGFTSLLADNISGNVIGLALGSLFRFVLYRVWVFGEHRARTSRVSVPRVDTGSVSTTVV
jgi:putative flippase GtrA